MKDILWENLVSTVNKAEAQTKIQENINLNHWYPKEKYPLKMSLNFCDNKTIENAPQANNASQAKLGFEDKKYYDKVEKKKRKQQKKKREKLEKKDKGKAQAISNATGYNTTPIKKTGQKQGQSNIFEITGWTFDKKSHNFIDCIELTTAQNQLEFR